MGKRIGERQGLRQERKEHEKSTKETDKEKMACRMEVATEGEETRKRNGKVWEEQGEDES